MNRRWLGVACLPLLGLVLSWTPGAETERTAITWKRIVLDKGYHSEGVAVADVNRDGKADVIAGDVWYEAPNWVAHSLRTVQSYGDGANGYSQSFCCFADDINGDGWPDVLIIGFPGQPCHWYENPQGKNVHWKEHRVWRSACNETPQYVDLFGDGKKKLIMGIQPEGQLCWFEPDKDLDKPWVMHPISEPSPKEKRVPGTDVYYHGLGVGDLNGDGRADVICPGGWWEQPARDEGKPWKFHAAQLGEACADMFAYDVNGDGVADVISSSAHNYGIWWHRQVKSDQGESTFETQALFPHLVSQTHALHCVDINGDGLKDLVTGKRWWAHGPHGDADPMAPANLYWFEAKRGSDGMVRFTPHLIDNDSGIGTQFVVADVNGDKLLDVVVANKKGVFVFEQVRDAGKKAARSIH